MSTHAWIRRAAALFALAIASACAAAAPREPTARAPEDDDAHFPAEMPVVTYYHPLPQGPLGSLEGGAVHGRPLEMIP